MARRGLVIGVIVIVILVASVFYYYEGGNLGSSGIGGNSAAPITVSSAELGNNDTLSINLANNGGSSTKTIQALDACSPMFSQCQDLNAYASTFVLPSGSSYVENLTIPQEGFSSNLAPGWGAPIIGQTYYFKLGITFANGDSQDLDVSAITTGHYNFANPFGQGETVLVTAIDSSNLKIFGNLSGRMSIVLTLDNPFSSQITADLLNTTDYSSGIPVQTTLVTATSGCSSAYSCPNIVQAGPSQVTLTADFSSVTTGISSGTYYVVTINFANYGTYFLWMQAQKVTSA